jgi:hypothetical protein
MAKNTMPNRELTDASPVERSLASELRTLHDSARAIVANLSNRLVSRATAERSMQGIIEKAYALGGRAEWAQIQAYARDQNGEKS